MIDNFDYSETERVWQDIDEQFKDINKNPKKKVAKKVVYDNPLQEKYQELCTRYANDFGKNDGSIECERLLDELYAFERVFRVMGWNLFPNK
jgi:hypothetical protein